MSKNWCEDVTDYDGHISETTGWSRNNECDALEKNSLSIVKRRKRAKPTAVPAEKPAAAGDDAAVAAADAESGNTNAHVDPVEKPADQKPAVENPVTKVLEMDTIIALAEARNIKELQRIGERIAKHLTDNGTPGLGGWAAHLPPWCGSIDRGLLRWGDTAKNRNRTPLAKMQKKALLDAVDYCFETSGTKLPDSDSSESDSESDSYADPEDPDCWGSTPPTTEGPPKGNATYSQLPHADPGYDMTHGSVRLTQDGGPPLGHVPMCLGGVGCPSMITTAAIRDTPLWRRVRWYAVKQLDLNVYGVSLHWFGCDRALRLGEVCADMHIHPNGSMDAHYHQPLETVPSFMPRVHMFVLESDRVAAQIGSRIHRHLARGGDPTVLDEGAEAAVSGTAAAAAVPAEEYDDFDI